VDKDDWQQLNFGRASEQVRFYPYFVPVDQSLEELRAWAMAEVTQDLLQRAEVDWGRYGVQRFRWEEKFRDPQDVLRQAERVKKQIGQTAAEKRAKRA
jgi:hypothetical protein